MRKHWQVVATFIVVFVALLAGSVYVFLWFVSNAQSSGLVPTMLGFWTLANLVNFILHAIFWEFLLVGIPLIIVGVVGWRWWTRLPEEEKRGYHMFGKRPGKTRGGGGVSLFFFILFCIKVYLDGNWNLAIANYSVDYVVGSLVLILEWVLVITGIPAAIALIWWIRHETKKGTSQAAS